MGGTKVSEGFDCSGFIIYIFGKFNLDLPRTSKSQASAGEYVAKSDLRPGDLVFSTPEATASRMQASMWGITNLHIPQAIME